MMKGEGRVRTDLGFCKSGMDGNEAVEVRAFDQGRKHTCWYILGLGNMEEMS